MHRWGWGFSTAQAFNGDVLGGMATLGFLGLFLGPTLLALGYELIRQWNAVETAPEPQS